MCLCAGTETAAGSQAAAERPAHQTRAEDHEVPAASEGETGCNTDEHKHTNHTHSCALMAHSIRSVWTMSNQFNIINKTRISNYDQNIDVDVFDFRSKN